MQASRMIASPWTRRRGFAGWGVGLFVLMGVSAVVTTAFAYRVGLAQANANVTRLTSDLAALDEARRQATQRAAVAEQQAEVAERQVVATNAAIAAAAPPPALTHLIALLTSRATAGVPLERLAFVLDQAKAVPTCDPRTESRSLQMRVPGSEAAAVASLAGDRIAVVGRGSVASGADTADAIFDPAAPVEIRVLPLGHDPIVLAGTLPLASSVVIDNREYRMMMQPSAKRGFVDVGVQSCSFP